MEEREVVLFSDEWRMCFHANDGRARVYRVNDLTRTTFQNGYYFFVSGFFIFLGSMNPEAKTNLICIIGSSTQRFLVEVFEAYFMLFVGFIDEIFVFTHDNTKPQTPAIVPPVWWCAKHVV